MNLRCTSCLAVIGWVITLYQARGRSWRCSLCVISCNFLHHNFAWQFHHNGECEHLQNTQQQLASYDTHVVKSYCFFSLSWRCKLKSNSPLSIMSSEFLKWLKMKAIKLSLSLSLPLSPTVSLSVTALDLHHNLVSKCIARLRWSQISPSLVEGFCATACSTVSRFSDESSSVRQQNRQIRAGQDFAPKDVGPRGV